MNPNETLEFTGENVEAAIAVGLSKLGVMPTDVLVEVIEEATRGVFGIGARPAKVRLKLLRPVTPPPPVVPVSAPAPKDSPAQRTQPSSEVHDFEEEDDDFLVSSDDEVEVTPGEDGAVGRDVLLELLNHLGIKANIVVKRADSARNGENAPWILDIVGGDMSLLIGRRGETLNSLQYVTRLIVSRILQRRANVIVDAGGYKSRRSDRLQKLALRMADQAIQQARTVILEPMPPNERRIIHLALRGRSDVETRSTGEGASRKVTIVPK